MSYLKFQTEYKNNHYSSLKKGAIEYIQSKIIEMFKIVIPILDEYNIHYFLCGGSLRGAYIQKSILPWDEDIDLCVVDEDYERMLDILIKALPQWILVQCKRTEQNYYHGWTKIRDKHSHIYPDEPLYKNNGVFMDIYKMQLVQDNLVEYEIAKEHYSYLQRRLSVGGLTDEEFKHRVEKNCLMKRLNTNIEEKSIKQKYIIFETHRVILDLDDCFPRKLYKFEDIDVYSFNKPDKYLKQHYGDEFNVLPSYEKRMIETRDVEIF